MGVMPAIIAHAVIRIARMRLVPPCSADAVESPPSCRRISANVTNRIELATATPIAMIAPMKDCTLSVVPVTASITATPHSTAGTVASTASASRTD